MKMKVTPTLLLLALTAIIYGCTQQRHMIKPRPGSDEYDMKLAKFKSDRLAGLKSPYGWTSVVGLYEFKKDQTTFGSGDDQDFLYPSSAPAELGIFTKKEDGYHMTPAAGQTITVDDEPVNGTIKMNADMDEGGPTVANMGSLQWYVANRKERNFIRLRDTLSPYRDALTEIPAYPVSNDYVIVSKFTKAPEGEVISYNTVIGVAYEVPVMGWIDFEVHGKKQRLTALGGGPDSYYIIFGDETTGIDTYGGGRFLYPEKEDENGTIILDFNRAINPPCVFTPYATCPLPPAENVLPVAIEAGEKMLHLY